MSLSKIPFVIERTENKYKENFIFKVYSLNKDRRFTDQEMFLLSAFFDSEGIEPLSDFTSGTITLYNLKSLLDFSYGEFHVK